MKQVIIIEGLQAVSINNAYYNDRRHGYKTEVKHWISQVCYQLSQPVNKLSMRKLREHFNPKKHSFTVYIKYTTPKFFNKQGTISHQSMDAGNISKVLLDVLFTEAFYGSNYSENIKCDDTFISALMVKKAPGNDYKIEVTVKIVKLPTS